MRNEKRYRLSRREAKRLIERMNLHPDVARLALSAGIYHNTTTANGEFSHYSLPDGSGIIVRRILDATPLDAAPDATTNDAVVRSPPAPADFLLHLVVARERAEEVIGDFQERFELDCERYGEVRARRYFTAGVLQMLWPAIWMRLRKWGIFGIIIAALKN